jgi:predicted ATPase
LTVEDLAHRIDAVVARRATRLVAIDGRGGAGKSRLATELEK